MAWRRRRPRYAGSRRLIDFALVGLVAASAFLLAGRFKPFWAWMGAVCYFASLALSNSYILGDDITQARLLWHGSLSAILIGYTTLCIALACGWRSEGLRKPPSWVALCVLFPIAAVGYAIWVWNMGDIENPYERHTVTALLMLGIAGACWLVFVQFTSSLLAQQLVWGILAVAESFALVEFVACQGKMFNESETYLQAMWKVEVSPYVCSRAFGSDAVHFAPLATTLVLLYVLVVISKYARRSGDHR